MKTKQQLKKYLKQLNPAGLKNARVTKQINPERASYFTWLVYDKGKKYLVKIAKPDFDKKEAIVLEYSLLKHLQKTTIAPKAYWLDPSHYLIIEDYLEGKWPHSDPKKEPSEKVIKAMAKTLARLHKIKPPKEIALKQQSYPKPDDFERKIREIDKGKYAKPILDKTGFIKFVPRIKRFLSFAEKASRRKRQVLLHNNTYLVNFLIDKQNKARLIDFKAAAIGEPSFDFGNIFVWIGWRKPGYYEKYKNVFLREYQRYHKYPGLAKLFSIQMLERDVASFTSELKIANQMKVKSAAVKYLKSAKPEWRVELIKKQLEDFGF
ncbi:MAG: phosphotransferase [Patescibacteria group bacterium]